MGSDGCSSPRLLDLDGIAEHLGVSTRHVRRLVAERRIPFLKWGHLLRFDPVEIATWIDDCRVRPPTMSYPLGTLLDEEAARVSPRPGFRIAAHERRLNSPPTEEEPWAGAAPLGTFASCRQVATRRAISTRPGIDIARS